MAVTVDEELTCVRRDFNAALGTLRKVELRDRVIAKLQRRVDVLGPSEAIALLRKVEALL